MYGKNITLLLYYCKVAIRKNTKILGFLYIEPPRLDSCISYTVSYAFQNTVH